MCEVGPTASGIIEFYSTWNEKLRVQYTKPLSLYSFDKFSDEIITDITS